MAAQNINSSGSSFTYVPEERQTSDDKCLSAVNTRPKNNPGSLVYVSQNSTPVYSSGSSFTYVPEERQTSDDKCLSAVNTRPKNNPGSLVYVSQNSTPVYSPHSHDAGYRDQYGAMCAPDTSAYGNVPYQGLPYMQYHAAASYQSTQYHQPAATSYSSSSGSSDERKGKEKKVWGKSEILCLIDIYEKKKNDFKSPKIRNKDIWHSISEERQANGYFCDYQSCETKFKNLKRAYSTCIDHNNKTGNDPKKCSYFDELHNIFHNDDNVRPQALFSNRKGLVKRDSKTQDDTDDIDVEGEEERSYEEEEVKPRQKKPRKKPQSEKSELITMFKGFVEQKEEKEQQKIVTMKEMHTEKMNFLGQFLKVFEKSVKDK